MKIECVERKSAILSKSSLACLSKVASINLTSGCAHQCIYCYTQGYHAYPGGDVVRLYANAPEKLRAELRRKRRFPRVVYFSPSCDLFQPDRRILSVAWEVLNILLKERIRIAFLTKGVIPDRHFRLLSDHASLVRAQVGVITVNKALCRIFEPRAAPPNIRLAQVKELKSAGIEVTGRVDPILPGLTDRPDALEEICSAFQDCGVHMLAAGILFLRPAISHSLKKKIRDQNILQTLLDAFSAGSRLPIHAAKSSVVALPAEVRREIFDSLTTVAARYGITVAPCACKNPDIAGGCCHIAGHWPKRGIADQQARLFPK